MFSLILNWVFFNVSNSSGIYLLYIYCLTYCQVTIHKSTLICCIVGFFGNEEYLCGEAFLPFENLNLNIENILTVNFQPIHVLPVTHDLQLTKVIGIDGNLFL